jgi:predicted metalloprotease
MRQRLLVIVLLVITVVAPRPVSAQSTIGSVVSDIDAFWAEQFANAGLTYTPPQEQAVDGPLDTDCGPISPEFGPGAYCAANQTIYYSTLWAPDDGSSDVVWFTVLGHEMGHHVQQLVDTGISSTLEAEQQADCFSGAFMRHAEDIGLVSPEVVTEGLSITQGAGDVWYELPADSPAHGNKAERAMAFMTGMNGGVTACGFPG